MTETSSEFDHTELIADPEKEIRLAGKRQHHDYQREGKYRRIIIRAANRKPSSEMPIILTRLKMYTIMRFLIKLTG